MSTSYSENAIKKFVLNSKAGIEPAADKWRGIEITNESNGITLMKDGKAIVPIERVDQVLQALYDDPETGLKSYAQLWDSVKERYIGINSKDVKQFTRSQETEQVQRPVVRATVNKPVIKSAPNEQWHIDLVDMSALAGLNNGVKYLLTVIDAFSKKAWVFPLSSKEDKGVSDAMQSLFETESKPLVIVSDNGSEFISRDMKSLLDSYSIRHIFTKAYSPQSNAQIERFNKTIKSKIYKFMHHYDSKHYIDALPKLVENYNSTIHSVTKRKPNELHALGVTNPRRSREVSAETQAEFDEAKAGIEKQAGRWLDKTAGMNLGPDIVQGDYVRIAEEQKIEVKKNKLFRKSYERQWSPEIYKVAWVNYSKSAAQPDTYTLMNPESGEIHGSQYFRDHLQRVDMKKLKKFNGARPSFNKSIFNREKFLQQELPAIRAAKEPVPVAEPEARITRAQAKKAVESPVIEPVVRRSGRERKPVVRYEG